MTLDVRKVESLKQVKDVFSVCQKPVMTLAAAHALSSRTLPSMTGARSVAEASPATEPTGGATANRFGGAAAAVVGGGSPD